MLRIRSTINFATEHFGMSVILYRISMSYILCMAFYFLLGAEAKSSSELECIPVTNCTECVVQGSLCVWCSKVDYLSELRCDTLLGHKARQCEGTEIINPTSYLIYKQNESLRNADVNLQLEAVQISPQRVHLNLSPGRSVKFPISYRIAEHYPVDLYYIMDLSFSMKDDQANLINLGESLASELKKISRDSRLGFGAFVDKAVVPFVGSRPETMENPCFPLQKCERTYGFINRLSLTTNTSTFGDKVRQTPISGNQDGPEGGLDGLLQAMVCNSEIGWRPGSRKIILYSTDARSHIAADAKIAGIIEPNDGFCHLNKNIYTHSLKQDYPSISHIASVAKNTSTSIIFAVSDFSTEYKEISHLIPSSVVGLLANDSSNIVNLVKEQYESLIKTVSLRTSGLPISGDVKVRLKSNCSRSDGLFVENGVCDSIGIGQHIHFEAEISLESCSSHSRRQSFVIKPDDLSDSIYIDVETSCECDCKDEVEKDTKCSGSGTYKCGLCSCDAGHSGEYCECDSADPKPVDSCLNPTTGLICSGHGDCDSCGSCKCDCLPSELEPACTRYSGLFCQCNNKGCNQRNGQLCSGRGNCTCNSHNFVSSCECDSGYLGEDCSCPVSDLSCRFGNDTSEVCYGKGICHCGKCQCADPCYEGKTCSILKPECSRTCVSFRECAVCYSRSAEYCTKANQSCSSYSIQSISSIDEKDKNSCSHIDENGCKNHFLYEYNSQLASWTIYMLDKPRCQKDYWLEVIIGICVGVLLLGILALIICKQIVTIHDKREFAKFQKETLGAKWKSTNNPIYKPAISTFQNPMYSGLGPENEIKSRIS